MEGCSEDLSSHHDGLLSDCPKMSERKKGGKMNGEMIWDKFEDMREVMGDTNLLIALADSLGTDKLYGELLYIDRMNDLGIFEED